MSPKATRVITDELIAYWGLEQEYVHGVVNHAVEYVRGAVHTNGVENFCSLSSASWGGTYGDIGLEEYLLLKAG